MFMISESQKYTAQTFNIAGFALFAPLGKIVLEPVSTFHELGSVGFKWYLYFSILLAIVGILAIYFGRGILKK